MSSLSFETPEDMPRGMKALYEAKMAKERAKQTAAASPEAKPKSKGGKYHAEKCAIGAVAAVGVCKGTIQRKFHLFGAPVDEPARKISDAQRPGRVGAGRPDHIGADDIKDTG